MGKNKTRNKKTHRQTNAKHGGGSKVSNDRTAVTSSPHSRAQEGQHGYEREHGQEEEVEEISDDHNDSIIVAASDLHELRKRQQDEVDAIQAIFADKCAVLTHDQSATSNELTLPTELRIVVNPTADVVESRSPALSSASSPQLSPGDVSAASQVTVQVILCVFFTNFYPLKPPRIWLDEVSGLKKHHTQAMQSELEKVAIEAQGREMVYDLVMAAQEYLDNHYDEVVESDTNVKSLFDIMSEEAQRKKLEKQKKEAEEKRVLEEQKKLHGAAMQREIEQLHMKKMLNVEKQKREKRKQIIEHDIMHITSNDALPFIRGIHDDPSVRLSHAGEDSDSESDNELESEDSDDEGYDEDDDSDDGSDSDDAALAFKKKYRRMSKISSDDSDSDEDDDGSDNDGEEAETYLGRIPVRDSPATEVSPNYFNFDKVFGSTSDDDDNTSDETSVNGVGTNTEGGFGSDDAGPSSDERFNKDEMQQLLMLRLLHGFCEDHLPDQGNAYDDLVDQLLKLGLLKNDQSLTDIKTFRKKFNSAFREQIDNSSTKGSAFSLLWDVPLVTRSSSSYNMARTRSNMDIAGNTSPISPISPRSPHRVTSLQIPQVQAVATSQPLPPEDVHNPQTTSRYRTDFEELEFIDKGAFGSVVKARNKLDQRIYAIKKILLPKDKTNEEVENKILREVNLLSRLHHEHIVRYYNAWREENNEVLDLSDDESDFEDDDYSSEYSSDGQSNHHGRSKSWFLEQSNLKSKLANTHNRIMYIQMEFCQTTLRQVIDDGALQNDKSEASRLFRQILEALTYLHDSDIIHRDLKPANIFFSVGNEVKVGDFGLAVKNRGSSDVQVNLKRNASIQELMDDIASVSQSLSTGVGTMIYAAPEVLNNCTYTSNVDCYSLGIIFLEMLLPPFATGMERYKCLQEVRRTGKVPSFFPMSYEKEREILELLLQTDPRRRPTARHLLERTDLLPVKREEETLSLLFSQKFEDYEIRLGNADGSHPLLSGASSASSNLSGSSSIGDFSYPLLIRREKFVSLLSAIFTLHGAMRFDLPSSFLPNSDQVNELAEKTQINKYGERFTPMMFRSGHIVQMAPDIVVPFARYLSRLPSTTVSFIKRYSFDRIIRENAASFGTPFAKTYSSFDVVGSTYKLVTEAEVLLTASQILSCMQPVRGKFVVRFNHTDIIRAVLKNCGIEESKYQATMKLLSKLAKSNWNYIRSQLTETLGLKEKSVNKLGNFLALSGDPIEVREKLTRKLFTQAQEALQDIATLIEHFNTWPVFSNDIVFDLSCCNDFHRYSGLMFQVGIQTRKRFISLGYGGRYDMLVSKFTLFQQDNVRHAVGMCWKFDKLVQATVINDAAQLLVNIRRNQVRRETNFQKSIIAGGGSISGSGSGGNIPTLLVSSSDVLLPGLRDLVAVCSTGKGMLADRMRIVYDLWSEGIPADVMYDDRTTLQHVKQFAVDHDVRWIVMTQGMLSRRNVVKVKYMSPQKGSNVDWSVHKRPIEVKTSELTKLLLEGPPVDQSQTKESTPSASYSPTNQFDPPSLYHITLGKSTSRKHKKRQDELALKRYAEMVHDTFQETQLVVVDLSYEDARAIVTSLHRSQQPDLSQFKQKKHSIVTELANVLKNVGKKKSSVAIYATENDRSFWFRTGDET